VEYSLPGLLGAFIGIVLGVINYGVIVGFVQTRLRSLDKSQSAEERAEFERKLSVMRRTILALDIVLFGAVGYWFGKTLGG
jgi:hypothetical protein